MIDPTIGKNKIIGALSWDKKSSLLTYLLKGGYFHTNAVTIRKSFLEKVGYFDQSCWPHEDSELWIRMAALGRIEAIVDSRPLSGYSVHEHNLSKKSKGKTKDHFWTTVLKKSKYLNFSPIQMALLYKQLIKVKLYG